MPGDNTVAIVAIGATSFIGVAAPAIAAVAERSRQRREHKHVRELNDLAERRRVIFEAMDQLTVFDWTASSPYELAGTPANVHEASVQFAMALNRLHAVLGPESRFAQAYEELSGLVVTRLTLESKGDKDALQRAADQVFEKRRELMRLARPFLLAQPSGGVGPFD